MRRLGLLAAAVVLASGALGATVTSAAPAPSDRQVPRPVFNHEFPDPAVVDTGKGLVAYATGDRVPHAWSRSERGAWRKGASLLTRLPQWSSPGGIWAVDVARVEGRWVLYYSAPVPGVVKMARCVAVAVAKNARGPFHPVSDRPLVCPTYAHTPAAEDPMEPRDRTLPRAGVIDPSYFRDSDGRSYLLYKTDRIPSTIRIVELNDSGLHVRPGQTSRELLRHDGVLENPVLSAVDGGYVMFASIGDWTKCSYRTQWFRSASLLDWSTAVSGRLMDQAGTGLCGPGGGDLVQTGDRTRIFLHGWTCHRTTTPCRGKAKWDHPRKAQGIRAMYAARIDWVDGVPRVGQWTRPRADQRSK